MEENKSGKATIEEDYLLYHLNKTSIRGKQMVKSHTSFLRTKTRSQMLERSQCKLCPHPSFHSKLVNSNKLAKRLYETHAASSQGNVRNKMTGSIGYTSPEFQK